jgi:hypothetical protein
MVWRTRGSVFVEFASVIDACRTTVTNHPRSEPENGRPVQSNCPRPGNCRCVSGTPRSFIARLNRGSSRTSRVDVGTLKLGWREVKDLCCQQPGTHVRIVAHSTEVIISDICIQMLPQRFELRTIRTVATSVSRSNISIYSKQKGVP